MDRTNDEPVKEAMQAALVLADAADDVCLDSPPQPRLRACVNAFWQAYARYDPAYRPPPRGRMD